VTLGLKATVVESLTKPRLAPTTRDIDAFNDLRRVRMLQAIEQVLSEFMQALQLDEEQSLPLVFVREILDKLKKAERAPVSQMSIDRLLKLTEKYPMWADAWLELGFLYVDAERSDDALLAFERAMRGTSLKGSDRINSLAIAAASHGRILASRGRHQEACQSFSYCLGLDPGQSMVAVEYAEQLHKLDQLDLAATYYVAGMQYRPETWNLPKFPRDARELTLSSLSPWKGIGLRPAVDVPVRSATESAVLTAE
jgi:tetratricopeptide (TPR) repeat protein